VVNHAIFVEIAECDLSETWRGENGYGHSGRF